VAVKTLTVTAVIPAHNAAPFIGEALDSVLHQTIPPTEIIVVDDGSTDGTPAVARRCDPLVHVIEQPQRGVSAARNAGIAAAKGEFIAFLDADDVWAPPKIERQLAAFARQPDATWSFTWYYEFGTRVAHPEIPQALLNGTYDPELISPDIAVLTPAVMVRASSRVRFPEWTGNNEDTIYFNELLAEGAFAFVPEPLFGYRKHRASAQFQPGAVERACRTMLEWVERQPFEHRERLRVKTLHALARQAEIAKWKRAWQDHAVMREFCLMHWPRGEAKPLVLTEHVWPRFVYRVKDGFDRLNARQRVR
jgi:glycosyltransferase involved in cell wall biosynthesis